MRKGREIEKNGGTAAGRGEREKRYSQGAASWTIVVMLTLHASFRGVWVCCVSVPSTRQHNTRTLAHAKHTNTQYTHTRTHPEPTGKK